MKGIAGRSRTARPLPAAPGTTRRLTEGALLAGVGAALGLILVPLFPPLAPYLIAQPFVALTVRRGVRTGLLGGAVATAVLGMVFGLPVGVPLGLTAVAIGVGLGWGIRRGLTAFRTVVLAGLGVVLVVTLLAAATSIALRIDPFETIARPMAESFRLAADLSDRSTTWLERVAPARDPLSRWAIEQTRAVATWYRAVAADMADVLRFLLPTLLATLVVAPTFIAYAIAERVLRRLGQPVPGFPPVLAWRISRRAAGAIALVVTALLAVTYAAVWRGATGVGAPARLLTLNLYLVMQIVFGAQAVLVVLALLKRRGVPVWLRAVAGYLIVELAQVAPLLGLILLYAGFLDSWYDFRRLGSQEGQPA